MSGKNLSIGYNPPESLRGYRQVLVGLHHETETDRSPSNKSLISWLIPRASSPSVSRLSGVGEAKNIERPWQAARRSRCHEIEIDMAFTEFSQQRIAGLLLGTDPFFQTRRDQIVALANRSRIVTIYNIREYVVLREWQGNCAAVANPTCSVPTARPP